MNTDALILTIVHQANTIREQATEIARLRAMIREVMPSPGTPAEEAPPVPDAEQSPPTVMTAK